MSKSTEKSRTKFESMSDYLPINSSSLRTDTMVGCDLFTYRWKHRLTADLYYIAEGMQSLRMKIERCCWRKISAGFL